MTPVPETSTPEASAAATAPPEQAEQDVEHLAEQLKNLDRAKMNEADAQRYDIANGLLISARRSLSKNDYMAANSLVEKAKVLIQGIGH